jgi:Transport and Golgi organisation 2
MCTVTFIPRPGTTFITSNRDENPRRQAKGLTSFHTPEWNAIHYPLDEISGGSWIALADKGRAVCLLNGGFKSFVPNPPYRQSRGVVVRDAALADSMDAFMHDYDLENIAPFTLLVYENNSLIQLVWDGEQKHISSLPVDQPQIWSSVTLYPLHVREWRKSLFEKWIRESVAIDQDSIISFHQVANGDPVNDFIMNRNEKVKTLSITSIVMKETTGSMLHLNLAHSSREEILVEYDR